MFWEVKITVYLKESGGCEDIMASVPCQKKLSDGKVKKGKKILNTAYSH